MRLLLDTHIFLWYISGDARLGKRASAISDPANEAFLSVVSLWEAIIKHHLGKLPLPREPQLYLPEQRQRHRIASLAVTEQDVAQLTSLPPLHRDPFDRLLLCQAKAQALTLVTVDEAVLAYPEVQLL
jgi:PIN domain nuclease of toxin-antitoxin system